MMTLWSLLLLLLTIKATVQDFSGENCKDSQTWKSLPLPVKDQPETVLPGEFLCTEKKYETGWNLIRCGVVKPPTRVNAKSDILFNHNGQVYRLECSKEDGPEVTPAGDRFARWVIANAPDLIYSYSVPVVNDAGASIKIFFTMDSWNEFGNCNAFAGKWTSSIKADKTGRFVKQGAAYTMQCFNKAPPKLQKVENFANEICNGKSKKAKVEVTGKGSPIPSVCVSFSCSDSKQITKCNPDCKTFGGNNDVSDKPISFTKEGKSYEATCTADGLPSVVYKGG